MATSKASGGSFGEFLRGAPKASEAETTIALTGEVFQGENEGTFVLVSGGTAINLSVDAVRAYDVVEDGTTRKVVRVVVESGPRIWKLVYGDPGTTATVRWYDPQVPQLPKHLMDPITWVEGIDVPGQFGGFNPFAGVAGVAGAAEAQAGAVPFTMATGHQAPAEAVQAQAGVTGNAAFWKRAITDRWYDTPKHVIKDIRTDTISDMKFPFQDPNTGFADTLVEGPETIQEGAGTLQENPGFPGGFERGPVGPQF